MEHSPHGEKLEHSPHGEEMEHSPHPRFLEVNNPIHLIFLKTFIS